MIKKTSAIKYILSSIFLLISINIYPSIALKQYGGNSPRGFSVSGESVQHDSINNLLLTHGEHKLTPEPYEELNLYSGNFKLKYTDFSVAVAPGLNMEVNRVYTSGVYSYDVKNFLNENFLSSWHMGTAYIYEYTSKEACDREWCYSLLINTDGSIREFIEAAEKPGWGKTRDNWSGDFPNNTFYDPKGIKYIFGHSVALNKHTKHFLTKVETPDGHWIQYHYDGVFINKITSSDPAKNIDISINKTKYSHTYCVQHCDWERKRRKYQTYYFPAPENVYFNNKLIVSYDYTLGYEGGLLFLNTVTKSNGEIWRYGYEMYNLQSPISGVGDHTYRLQLSKVISPSGNITEYKQEKDPDNQYSGRIYGIRLKSRNNNGINNVMPAANWQFNYTNGKDNNNVNTKIVTVIGPNHAIKNIYSDSNSDYIWRQGRLLEQFVYKDNHINDDNIIQHDINVWGKVFEYKENYRLTRTTKYPAFDTEVNSIQLLAKTTQLYYSNGIDNFITEYLSFDRNNFPTNIVQTFKSNSSANGNSRNINIEYSDIKEKNILGLPAKLMVNNKLIQENGYDTDGHLTYSNKLGILKKYNYQNGLLASVTDGLNNTIKYSDYVGVEPQLITYPDKTITKKIVNNDGTIAGATDANGNATFYTHNDNGDVTKEQPALGDAIFYDYNYSNGFIKTTRHGGSSLLENINFFDEPNYKVENSKREFKYNYDALGRKIFESYANTNTGHYYSYDALNRITLDCYPLANSNCIQYQYSANNIKKIIYPSGEYAVNTYRAYNNPDHADLISIKENERETIIDRDELGHVLSVQQGNIIKQYQYDANYNLIKYTEPETGVTNYHYDTVGNLIEKNQNGQKVNYSYHPQNYRLLKTSYSDGSHSVLYGYDNNGNLINLIKGRIENSYQYNQLNKLISEVLIIHNKAKKYYITNNLQV